MIGDGLANPATLRVARAALGALAMAALALGVSASLGLALVLMLAAEAVVWTARAGEAKRGAASTFAPAAESLYHFWIFFGFMVLGWAAPWMLFVFFMRELAEPYIRSFAHQAGRRFGQLPSEKPARALTSLCQLAALGLHLGGTDAEIANAPLYLAVAVALWSLIECARMALKAAETA